MPQPTIAAEAVTDSGTSQTGHTINLPTGSGAGTRTLLFVQAPNNAGAQTISVSGFTVVGTNLQDTTTERSAGLFFIDGSHGSTVSATLGAAGELVAYAARVATFDTGENPVITSWSQTVGGTTTDPPNMAHGWGSVDVLYFTALAWYYGGNAVTSDPTNYIAEAEESTGFAAAASLAVSSRGIDASSSEDPGVWTMPSSDYLNACTVALRGTGAGGGGIEVLRRRREGY